MVKIKNDNPRMFDFAIGAIEKKRADLALFDKVPKNVFFDLFGTMIDCMESDAVAIRKIVGRGIEFPLKNGKILWDSFGDYVGENNVEQARSQYIAMLQTNILTGAAKPFPGLESVVKMLFALGSNVIAITNRNSAAVKPLFQKYPEIFQFVKVIGYPKEEGMPDKPDPASYFQTLKKAGLSPSDTDMFVGDAVGDIKFAKNAGMKPVLYGFNASHNTPELHLANQDIMILSNYQNLEYILSHQFPGGIDEYNNRMDARMKEWFAPKADDIFIEAWTNMQPFGYTNEQFKMLTPNGSINLEQIKEFQKANLIVNKQRI